MRKKLLPVPDACPKCAEVKGWVQIRTINPYDNQPSKSDNILDGLFEAGPIGAVLGAIFPVTKKVTYRCNNCDFRSEYKAR